MNVARNKDGNFEARFSEPLWLAFIDVLLAFPSIPPAHRMARPGKTAPMVDDSTQALLDEALAEHRQQLKNDLKAILGEPPRFRHRGKVTTLTLTPAEVECILQVLNNVRVGRWILLGSPPDLPEQVPAEHIEHLHMMELAGVFESIFLEALMGS